MRVIQTRPGGMVDLEESCTSVFRDFAALNRVLRIRAA
jgi:hypothetical protein